MRFEELAIEGAHVIHLEVISDERGHFARTFSTEEFRAHGLDPHVEQCNISFNERAGTLRGLHFQEEPYGEAKLIRCTRGSVFDVGLDLRPGSDSFGQVASLELRRDEATLVYWPSGIAHGFLTLEDASELTYQMSHGYVPTSARGVRWDDPRFQIRWPRPVEVVSARDASFPDFTL